jgi:hypothetical protein
MAGSVTFPPGVSAVGGVSGGLVVGSRGGVFLVGRDGGARCVAGGTPIGVFGASVVHHACDANFTCDVRVTEVVTGEQRRLEGVGELPGLDLWSTSVSPDGRFIAWLSSGSGSDDLPAAALDLFDLTTGRTVTPFGRDDVGVPGSSVAWSPTAGGW